MSFGFGAGDIWKALEICKWIWENCLQKPNSADQRYDQFRKDIKKLWRALEDLLKVIHEAGAELDPFEDDAKDIAGDFLETLKTCRDFLTKNVDANRGVFLQIIENVKWGLARNKEVDGLRARLQVHAQTLALVVAPVDTQLLIKIQRDISELIERHRSPGAGNIIRPETVVSEWLRGVFRGNLDVSRPVLFDRPENIPLRHGCRALRQHFSRLTEGDRTDDPRRELVQEYLALLKCQWLIEILRDGREFQSQPAGTPFRRFISNVDLEVCQRLWLRARSCAVATDNELMAAYVDNKQLFLIWEPPEERPRRQPWEAKEEDGEENLLTVSLKGDEKLVVIRRSPTTYRLVPIVETPGGIRRSDYQEPSEIRLNTDTFVPLYTVAHSGDTLAAEIYQHNHLSPVRFELADRRATWIIQHAITGYRVCEDQNKVTWSIMREINVRKGRISPDSRTEKLRGRVHIWQWNPLLEGPPDSTSPSGPPVDDPPARPSARSMSVPTVSRVSSKSTDSSPEYAPSRQRPSTSRNKTPSIAPSQTSVASTIRLMESKLPQGNGKHIELHPPVCPVVIFFGQSGLTHTYFHLEMSRDVFVDKTRCQCAKPKIKCKLMIIRRLDGKSFTIRRLSADGASGTAPLRRWNLSLFGGPGHPKEYYDGEGIVERIASDYLTLEFPTPELRADFSERLDKYFGDFLQEADDYESFIKRGKFHADRPKKPGDNDSGYLGSMYSLSSTSITFSQVGNLVPLPESASVSTFHLPFLDKDSK